MVGEERGGEEIKSQQGVREKCGEGREEEIRGVEEREGRVDKKRGREIERADQSQPVLCILE